MLNDKSVVNYNSLFSEWFGTASAQEKELYFAVLEYEEEFFPEMTFKKNSVISEFIECQILDGNNKLVNVYADVPFELSTISSLHYRYYIKELEDNNEGLINHHDRTMTVIPGCAKRKAVILHEMLHIYEQNLNSFVCLFHEILFLCLYNDLKGKISDLDVRIKRHSHIIPGEIITKQGGSHGILFFLKSLDLDLRCGYRLGTVCGYERDRLY